MVAEGDGYRVTVGAQGFSLKLKRGIKPGSFVAEFSDRPVGFTLVAADPRQVDIGIGDGLLSYRRLLEAPKPPPVAFPQATPAQQNLIAAPIPGKVIGALVKEGEKVKAGDPLVVLESMKMEVAVRSDRDAEVKEILVAEGTAVKRGQGLVRLA